MYKMKKVSVQVNVFGKSSLFVPFKAGSGVWGRVECQVVKVQDQGWHFLFPKVWFLMVEELHTGEWDGHGLQANS